MMNRSVTIALMMLLPLAACGKSHHDHDKMKAPLDKIRGMVKESAVLASQAACAEPGTRTDLIHASVVLLRRAMGGPEMDKIHKMMGQMTMDQPGKMPEKQANMSADQMIHIDIHAAGEDTFDFLDALSKKPALSCADVRPVSLAATASLLRESPSQEVSTAAKQLDDAADKLLKGKVPETVRALAQDLKKI
jgi:hypothetical protein